MKRSSYLLFLLLMGCQPEWEHPWSEADTSVSIDYGDGYQFADAYRFEPSTRTLRATWKEYGQGARPLRTGELQLSEEQAARLEGLVGAVRLDDAPEARRCGIDGTYLTLTLEAPSGEERTYYEEDNSDCRDLSRRFTVQGDIRTVWKVCAELLPEPS